MCFFLVIQCVSHIRPSLCSMSMLDVDSLMKEILIVGMVNINFSIENIYDPQVLSM